MFFELKVDLDSDSCGQDKGGQKSWNSHFVVQPVEVVSLDKIIALIFLISNLYWEF